MKGFTLVEFMILLAICGILTAIAVPQYKKWKDPYKYQQDQKAREQKSNEQRPRIDYECIGGFKFVINKDGSPVQIIGSNGHGVECFK